MTRTTRPSPPGVIDLVLDRLCDLGVRHLFGVAGDYNLRTLDRVLDHPGIDWVGTVGELGAAYAADGYARIKGFAGLLTTYGVGELNAVGAVAGSYSEHVPVLHIVIGPASSGVEEGGVVHHSLGDGQYGAFARAARQVACADAVLRPDTAVTELDRVLAACLEQHRPGYLLLPRDLALTPVEPLGSRPARPDPLAADAENLEAFTAAARPRLSTARTVAVLADLLVERFGARTHLERLLSQGRLPNAVLPPGKGILDENGPDFLGLYAAAGPREARDAVDSADLLIRAGVRLTDINTAGFNHGFDDSRGIDLRPWEARVDGQVFTGVPLAASLNALTQLVEESSPHRQTRPPHGPGPTPSPTGDSPLTQEYLWKAVAEAVQPGDVVAVDQGTPLFGIATERLPAETSFLAQPLWASIGYSLPALLGAQLADPSRRGVLLIGDGAAQTTVQELGMFGQHGLTPLMILVDNDGYTVERKINNPDAVYHDIVRWRWLDVPAAVGVPDPLTLSARTPDELDTALVRARAAEGRFVLIAVRTAREDAPALLRDFADAAQQQADPD